MLFSPHFYDNNMILLRNYIIEYFYTEHPKRTITVNFTSVYRIEDPASENLLIQIKHSGNGMITLFGLVDSSWDIKYDDNVDRKSSPPLCTRLNIKVKNCSCSRCLVDNRSIKVVPKLPKNVSFLLMLLRMRSMMDDITEKGWRPGCQCVVWLPNGHVLFMRCRLPFPWF